MLDHRLSQNLQISCENNLASLRIMQMTKKLKKTTVCNNVVSCSKISKEKVAKLIIWAKFNTLGSKIIECQSSLGNKVHFY